MPEKASIETNSIVLLNTLAFGTSSQVSTSMKCNIISVTHGKGFCKKNKQVFNFLFGLIRKALTNVDKLNVDKLQRVC